MLTNGDKLNLFEVSCEHISLEYISLLDEGNPEFYSHDTDVFVSYAIKTNSMEIIEHSIRKAKRYINRIDLTGKTPMYHAVLSGDIQIIECLLDNGADINGLVTYYQTALIFAANQGKINIMQYLINKGADLKVGDNRNWRPIHYCSNNGNLDEVKLLISKGDDTYAITHEVHFCFVLLVMGILLFILQQHVVIRILLNFSLRKELTLI